MKKRSPERSGPRSMRVGRSRSQTISRRAAVPRAGTSKSASLKPSGRRGTATARRSAESGGARQASKLTTDHEKIRRWTESRGGHPATVKRTARGGRQEASVLRIDFPGFSGANLKPISWDEWFDTFDERRLAFLYQEKTASGKPSRFNKLVCRK